MCLLAQPFCTNPAVACVPLSSCTFLQLLHSTDTHFREHVTEPAPLPLPLPFLRFADAPRRKPVTMMGNKATGGPFAPLVVVVRSAMGEKPFNQLRGKAISLHSQGEYCIRPVLYCDVFKSGTAQTPRQPHALGTTANSDDAR